MSRLTDIYSKWKENPKEHKASLAEELKLDPLNAEYFFALLQKHIQKASQNSRPLASCNSCDPDQHFVTTAVASDALLKSLPLTRYSHLLTKNTGKGAQDTALWIKKMQAGTGSSMTRSTYLAQQKKIPLQDVKIGAKGTDLYANINGNDLSIAEIQILQSFSDLASKQFGKIILHDIVSEETKGPFNALWENIHPTSSLSYSKTLEKTQGLERSGQTMQTYLPTLDADDSLSLNRTAPGGHGLFGVEALLIALTPEKLPSTEKLTLISSVGNGEDLSSTPDSYMVEWMSQEQIPLAMVTTTKTSLDLKGGQMGLYCEDGQNYLGIIEKAQAEERDQLALFESLGLRSNDNESFFNTNMILVNYDILSPMLLSLERKIGRDAIVQALCPDLIRNNKSQTDSDGETRTYTQLEGAMGSSLLNLDKLWRKTYGEPLVHILNVDSQHRTQFFCPIKSAFDYWLQFHSDRFSLNTQNFRLENHRPEKLPEVSLNHSVFKDVQSTLDRFKNTKVIDLEKLITSENLDFSGKVLSGVV